MKNKDSNKHKHKHNDIVYPILRVIGFNEEIKKRYNN